MVEALPIAHDETFPTDALTAQDRVDSAKLQTQIANIKNKLNELIEDINVLTRADNAIEDESVRLISLHPEVLAAIGGDEDGALMASQNLSDLTDLAAAVATLAAGGLLLSANNLSDLVDANAARIALGVNGALLAGNNLDDLGNLATALVNLDRGLPDGLCDLDGSGRIPADRLPAFAKRAEIVEDYLGLISALNGDLPTFPMVVGSSGYWVATQPINGFNPGQAKLSTNTTVGGYAASVSGTSLRLGNNAITYESVHQFQQLSDGTNAFTWIGGIINQVNAMPTNGAYFRYTHSVNAGKLQAVCVAASVETAVDTGYAANLTDWPRLTIVTNGAGTSVLFYINGSLVATIVTDIPGQPVAAGQSIIKSAGAAESFIFLDYQALAVALQNAR